MKAQRLPRWTRIRRRADFKLAYSEGRKVTCLAFALFARPNGREHGRIGVTATRKLGKSVVRSRAKRLVREAYREHREQMPAGQDYVVVVRTPMLTMQPREIGPLLQELARRATERE